MSPAPARSVSVALHVALPVAVALGLSYYAHEVRAEVDVVGEVLGCSESETYNADGAQTWAEVSYRYPSTRGPLDGVGLWPSRCARFEVGSPVKLRVSRDNPRDARLAGGHLAWVLSALSPGLLYAAWSMRRMFARRHEVLSAWLRTRGRLLGACGVVSAALAVVSAVCRTGAHRELAAVYVVALAAAAVTELVVAGHTANTVDVPVERAPDAAPYRAPSPAMDSTAVLTLAPWTEHTFAAAFALLVVVCAAYAKGYGPASAAALVPAVLTVASAAWVEARREASPRA